MNSIKPFIRDYGIVIGCVIFIVFVKIPHLNLPYSWDEAWSYIPAVLKMAETGPSIFPHSIDIHYSKGHPLFFYFIISGWINLYSTQIWWVRIMPLIISVVFTAVFFFVMKKHTSTRLANASVALISVQSLFLAQATLILPEILLTLLLVLSAHFFILKRWGLYAIFAVLMALTKETGLIFVAGFGLFYLLENRKDLMLSRFWKPVLFLSIPVFVYIIHLILTYQAYQTFFFNEHLDYISFEKEEILRVLKSSTAILFTLYGRNTISAVAIISLVVILFRKERIRNGKILILLVLQMVLLILFTSINFYTYRYMLPAFPAFIALSMILFDQSFKKLKFVYYPLLAIMVIVPLFFTITKKGKTDIDLGYASYLPLHKEMVEFCETQNWDDKTFAAEFNMVLALRDPFTGYHTEKTGFKLQHLPKMENADIVVLDSTGEWDNLPENQKENYQLIKRFENKYNWGEIYLLKN